MDDLDRLRLGLPTFETAGAGPGWNVRGHQLSAFASCARWCDVPLEIVMRAVGTNKLADLIGARGGRTASRRNFRRSHLARLDQLRRRAELMRKQIPSWL